MPTRQLFAVTLDPDRKRLVLWIVRVVREVNLKRMRQVLSSSLTFSGNVYYRYIRTSTLNGDMNEDSLDQAIYQPSAADIRPFIAMI